MSSTAAPGGELPAGTEQDIQTIIKNHGLTGTPVWVPVRPMNGYAREQCHVSAKHAELAGHGTRVYGWAFWTFNRGTINEVIFAFHHSVIRDGHGNLVDVTPPSWPATQILFLEDSNAIVKRRSNDLIFKSTLTPLADKHKYNFRGVSHPYSEFPISVNDKNLIAYCDKLGLKPREIP